MKKRNRKSLPEKGYWQCPYCWYASSDQPVFKKHIRDLHEFESMGTNSMSLGFEKWSK